MESYEENLINRGKREERVRSVVYMLKRGISEVELMADFPDVFDEGKAEFLRIQEQEDHTKDLNVREKEGISMRDVVNMMKDAAVKKERVRLVIFMLENGIEEAKIKLRYPDAFYQAKEEFLSMPETGSAEVARENPEDRDTEEPTMKTAVSVMMDEAERKERVRAVIFMLKNGVSEEKLKARCPDAFDEGKAEFLRIQD